MSNWKAGDIAIICNNYMTSDSDPIKYRGVTCVLVRYVGLHETETSRVMNAWEVDTDTTTLWVNECVLRRPYDGNEIVEWSSCIFQPKVLELVER